MATVEDEIAALRDAAKEMVASGRAEGIEPDGPLGVWLRAQVGALGALASVLEAQAKEVADAVVRIETAAEAEVERLKGAVERGNELTEHCERVLRQVRFDQSALNAERVDAPERLAQVMIPLLAEHLPVGSGMREMPWDRGHHWFGYVMSALAAVAIFFAGYGVSSVRNGARAAAFNRCLADAYVSGSHVYCRADQFFAKSKAK